ncbi:28001_t:CDS:2, partial [Racocetra persica]
MPTIHKRQTTSLDFTPRPDKHILREALVKWFAMDCLLFTSIKSEYFCKLVEPQ